MDLMRRLLTFAVVGFWAVMVGALVRKQLPPSGAAMTDLPAGAVRERDEWFAVQREGRQVGHAHRVTARRADGQVFSEDSVIAVAMLGVPQTLVTSLVAETDEAFALQRFRFRLVTPAAVFSATGTSDGRQLAVAYGPEGHVQRVTLPLTEPIYLPSTLRPRVLAGDLVPGTTYTAPVFNPLTLRNEPLTVTIEGREDLEGPDGRVEAVRLSEEHQGLRARVWLAPDGAVLREEGSLGFTLVRQPREVALADRGTGAPVDLVATSLIPLVGHIDDPRRRDRLTLRVGGDAAGSIPDDPPRQRIAAGVLRIAREEPPAPSPLAGAPGGALAAYVAPSPFIESDDAAIVAATRAVVGAERDATAAARRLVAWVHRNVEQEPSVTVPSAREVLASRRGDCNELAVLLTALARAAGIPARMVAGAMYQNDAFYYHAWTELWLGRWVSADAVFDQMPADATHVKLLEGGPERHVALAGIVGRLAFAVQEAGS